MTLPASAFPLFTLDFEASSLGTRSYPIEVGVARWSGLGSLVESWSTIIRPTSLWIAHGEWSSESEVVHSIKRGHLDEGISPRDAMAAVNQFVTGKVAFCDGGVHDLRWLAKLANAAETAPAFQLGDWDALGALLSPAGFAKMVEWLEQNRTPHRAGPDAERLLNAIRVGLE